MAASNSCVLLLTRPLGSFLLRDQAEDLLRTDGVTTANPPKLPLGLYARLPRPVASCLAWIQARKIKRGLDAPPRVVVVFHPLQLRVAQALMRYGDGRCELWYARWDRYENAYDANPRLRKRITKLHDRCAALSKLTFTVSEPLTEIEREAGRTAVTVGLTADSFPAPDPNAAVIAVSFGHHGHRIDWTLLREVAELMPELTVLVIGPRHDSECEDDPDFVACTKLTNFVWLGYRSDSEAAQLIQCADVGILPFKIEPFNDSGLPFRILKAARLGRLTIVPELRGVSLWERSVVRASTPDQWVAALRDSRGVRTAPNMELRDWAMTWDAPRVNAKLRERLAQLGFSVDS